MNVRFRYDIINNQYTGVAESLIIVVMDCDTHTPQEVANGTNLHYIISDHSHIHYMIDAFRDYGRTDSSYEKFLRIQTKGTNGEYLDFKLYGIIGKAGTGKSQFITDIMLAFPRAILCSSTHAAANNVTTRLRNSIGPSIKDAFIATTVHSLLGWNIDKYLLSPSTTKNLASDYEQMMSLDSQTDTYTYDKICVSIMNHLTPVINHLMDEHKKQVNFNSKLSAFVNAMTKNKDEYKKKKQNKILNSKLFRNNDRYKVFENLQSQEEFIFALETFCRVLLNTELSKLLLGHVFIIEEAGRVPAYIIHLLINVWYHVNHYYQTPQCRTHMPIIFLVGSTSQSKVINFNYSTLEECQTIMKFNKNKSGISLYTYNRRMSSTSIMAKLVSQIQTALEFGEQITEDMEKVLDPLVVQNSFYDPSFRPDAIRIVKRHSDAKKYVEKFHNLKSGNLITIYEYLFVAGDIRSLSRKRHHSSECVHNEINKFNDTRLKKLSKILERCETFRGRHIVGAAISAPAENLLDQDEFSYQYSHKDTITNHLREKCNNINFTSNTQSLNSLYTDLTDMNLAFTIEVLPADGDLDKNIVGECVTYHMYKLKRELTDNCTVIVNHKTKLNLRGFYGSFIEFSNIIIQNRDMLPHLFILRVALEYVEKYISCCDLETPHLNFENVISRDMSSRFKSKTWVELNSKLTFWKSTIDTLHDNTKSKKYADNSDSNIDDHFYHDFQLLWNEIQISLFRDETFASYKLTVEPQFHSNESYIRSRNALPGDTTMCTFVKMVPFHFSNSWDISWSDKEHLPDRCSFKLKTFCGMLWSELKHVKGFNTSIPAIRLLIGGKFIADTVPQLSNINWKSVFPQGLFAYAKSSPSIGCSSTGKENEDECDTNDLEDNPMVLSSDIERASVIGLFTNCVENVAQTIDFCQGATLSQPTYLDVGSCTSQRDLLVGITRNTNVEDLILTTNKISVLPPSDDLQRNALNITRSADVYKIY